MRILLAAMPDTADVIDHFVRLPNLAIVSLAGNLSGHDVKVLDLVLRKPRVGGALRDALQSHRPHLVGLSAMTFQFETLLKAARFVRRHWPRARIAAGGYHVSLLAAEIADEQPDLPFDFMIRGEGEATFRELAEELEKPRPDLGRILGLSYRQAAVWKHNPDRPLQEPSSIALPNRRVRLAQSFSLLDLPIDVAETSRGCPFQCKFCCISRMYGPVFRPFPMERVVADLKAIRDQGFKGVFLADDNITWDIQHFRRVCRAVVENGLNDLFYSTQVTALGIARHPTLVEDMERANFKVVFVGFESMDPALLKGMKKPSNPEINQTAAALLRRHGMAVIAGCIVGFPMDTARSVREQYRAIVQLKPDMIYAQYLTPYPGTPVRKEMKEEGLIVNENDYSTYDGFSCNTRTHHLSRETLYRILKQEAVRAYLTPSLAVDNYLLRRFGRSFLKAACKAFATNIYNVLTARQKSMDLDI